MIIRRALPATRRALQRPCCQQTSTITRNFASPPSPSPSISRSRLPSYQVATIQCARPFSTNRPLLAQPPTADALMENLNDLYATAKDEFEIAAEETEKKTVYAADDREAAKEALQLLKEAYEKAVRESGPDVAKEVQSRSGHRIRELENAVTAMEEMAMED